MDLNRIQQFSTLVKVKRRRNETNSESLVIKYKRRRTNKDTPEDDSEKFLTYAGTLTPNQSQSHEEVVKLVDKSRLQSFSTFRDRKRTHFEQDRKERRLKIIDSYRNIGPETEKQENCVVINAENVPKNPNDSEDDDDDCVFDVFVASGGEEIYEFDDLDILIQEVGGTSYLVNEVDSDDEDDSDSNRENHCANEYPDSEPDDFDEYLIDKVDKLRFGCELSSDEYSDFCSSDNEHSYYKRQEKLFAEISSNEDSD